MKKSVTIYERGVPRVIDVDSGSEATITRIPTVEDTYADSVPQNIRSIDKYEANPITRAQSILIKTSAISLVLSVLTVSLLYFLSWYPHTWGYAALFVFWLMNAMFAFIWTFSLVAVLDYRETPQALLRKQWDDVSAMMKTEQQHRLRAMYPKQFLDED